MADAERNCRERRGYNEGLGAGAIGKGGGKAGRYIKTAVCNLVCSTDDPTLASIRASLEAADSTILPLMQAFEFV